VFGSRMALMLSCSAAVLAYGILSLANSVPMLFFVQNSYGLYAYLSRLVVLIPSFTGFDSFLFVK